jgi:hypothetical protein
MKISITDKFLWDAYNVLQETGDIILHPYPTMANSLPGPKNPLIKKYRREKGKRQFSNLIYYLKRKGYIKVKELEGKQALILTKGGIDRALKASFMFSESKKKRKDGKWIMLIFDIPVNNAKARDLLRSILQNLGYKLLQQSVWVCPFDVFEKTEKLLQMHSLEKYVKIFLVEEL